MQNNIYIDVETRNIKSREHNFLGIAGEHEIEQIVFKLSAFISGEAILEIQKYNKENKTEKYFINLERQEESYIFNVKNSLLDVAKPIEMQLHITTANEEVFKSKIFEMQVYEAIDATETVPEQYEEWIDVANSAIAKMSELEQTISKSEEQRQKAETSRDNSEKTRNESEKDRLQKEEERQEAEQERIEKEKTRIKNESDRIINENGRIEAEKNRKSAEESRTENEAKRAESEEKRAQAEETRAADTKNAIAEIKNLNEDYEKMAEEKTEEFNSNVETKTTEFNNNSTEKINAFNSNAEEKITDYNEHVETLTSRIAELEEETEDLFNALNTEKVSGTELYIDDAKACRVISSEIDGMYQQETTTGTNLMNLNVVQNSNITVNEDGTITINGSGGFNLAFESFTFKANTPYYIKWEIVSGTVIKTDNIVIRTPDNSAWALKDEFTSFSVAEDKTIRYVWIHKDAKFENAKIRIWISESQSDFELYTGKIPSPSPDYPQAIEQVESVKLNIKGKNLCDGINQNYYLNNDLNICGKVTGNSGLAIDVQDKSYVTVSTKITQNRYRIACINSLLQKEKATTVAYRGVRKDNTSATVTIDTTGYKYLIINATDLSSILVENGSVATEYEPYQKQTVVINLNGNKPYAISDTIKDKLLIDRSGNVALQKNVGEVIFNGNEHWELAEKGFYNSSYFIGKKDKKNFEACCNYFLVDRLGKTWTGLNHCGFNNSGYFWIQEEHKLATTPKGFNEWLTTHNLEVYYALATPEIIDLGQLTELPKTFDGINNIWAETNLGNTEIEIEYVQDVKKLLEQQNARLDNIEALLSTTETSALLLDNMQNDLEKEVK